MNLLHRTASGAPWDTRVSDAVRHRDADTVIRLVAQHGGVRRLREGFTIDSQGSHTFAQLCLRTSAISVMRALLAAAPNGVTLQDCCSFHVEDRSGLSVSWKMVLHEEALALDYPSAEAMALALAVQPTHPSLAGPLERFDGASLHYEALRCATHFNELDKVRDYADCARQLMAFEAPLVHGKDWMRASATEMLFGSRWHVGAGFADVLVPLIHDYAAAGWVDIDKPTDDGHPPLRLAIVTGNGHAAAAAIALGCNLEAAASENFPDLVAFAERCVEYDPTGGLPALVTDALMHRRLRELETSPGECATRTPIHRRAQRASL